MVTIVAGEDVGRQASIDVAADGTVGVAHFSRQSRADGVCEGISGEPPRTRVPLHYSWKEDGADTWETEPLREPIHAGGEPEGVSFRFSPDGTPAVAIFGGAPVDPLCSSNDLLFGERGVDGEWSFETAVASSGEAPVLDGEDCTVPVSVAGNAVGVWPALAFDGSGHAAILYRDIHFGGLQRDDVLGADAELAMQGVGWEHVMVDCGNGGGFTNAAAFDTSDRLVAAHVVTVESHIASHGLWLARLDAEGSWERIRLTAGSVQIQESSLATGPGGAVAIAYYDVASGALYVAELSDSTRFADPSSWETTAVTDPGFNEGLHPSLAYAPSGRLLLAFYRCAFSGDSECSPTLDGLMYARRSSRGSWSRLMVDEGDGEACGMDASLAIDSAGQPWIAYSCARDTGDGAPVVELKVATPL